MPGHRRNACLCRDLFRRDLVAHRLDRLGGRADEIDAFLPQAFGKPRVFRKKSISGMHRHGSGLLAGLDDLFDIEIAFCRRRGPNRNGFVGHPNMKSVSVGLRIDGHRPNAHPPGGLDDPAGDLATIGYEDFRKHLVDPHSGMFPCFFVGPCTVLWRSVSKARATLLRVLWGMITSSMKPRSAATKG